MRKILIIAVLFLLSATAVFAAEEVDITIAENDIYINGQYIDNTSEAYPFIRYNLITYVPMTWDMTYALGLKVDWDLENGLRINKRNETQFYEQRTFGTYAKGKTYKAIVLDAPIKVNGKEIDNSQEKYPVLRFNNIMYFPMTWRFMVDEFNSGYRWSEEAGLRITADASLKKIYRAPVEKTFEVDIEELRANNIFINEQVMIEPSETRSWFVHLFYDDPTLNDRILNVFIDHYDEKGDFLYTEVHRAGLLYKYGPEKIGLGALSFSIDDFTSKVVFRLQYLNKRVAMDQLKDDQGDVKIIVIDSENFSENLFKGYTYFDTANGKSYVFSQEIDDDCAKYAAFYFPAHGFIDNKPVLLVHTEDNGKRRIITEDYPPLLERISAFDTFRINLENSEGQEFEKVMNGRTINASGEIIYLFDSTKKLKKIIVIKDLLEM